MYLGKKKHKNVGYFCSLKKAQSKQWPKSRKFAQSGHRDTICSGRSWIGKETLFVVRSSQIYWAATMEAIAVIYLLLFTGELWL
jgi:hypothetical protein